MERTLRSTPILSEPRTWVRATELLTLCQVLLRQ